MKNIIVLLIKQKFFFCKDICIPRPYKFISIPLRSVVMGKLTEIVSQINQLIPQLSDFINQFNNIIITKNINVITDSSGNLSIDIPFTMSDVEAEKISKKISIITIQSQEINNLL